MTPDQIDPEQDDDEQFEWYDEEPEPEDDKEWVVSEKPRVTVDGYVLTHLGRLVYCTSGPDAKRETK